MHIKKHSYICIVEQQKTNIMEFINKWNSKFKKWRKRSEIKQKQQEEADLFDKQYKQILKLLLLDKTPKESVKLFNHVQKRYLLEIEKKHQEAVLNEKILKKTLSNNKKIILS